MGSYADDEIKLIRYQGVILYFTFTEFISIISDSWSNKSILYSILVGLLVTHHKLKMDQQDYQITRYNILQFIIKNPGSHYNKIRRKLNLSNGVAAYHLNIMLSRGIVECRSDKIFKRYYRVGYKIPKVFITPKEEQILEILILHPGLTQKEIAVLQMTSQPAVAYHLKRLKEKGVVYRINRQGWYVSENYMTNYQECTCQWEQMRNSNNS